MTIPDGISDLEDHEQVDEVVQYQGGYADYSIILKDNGIIQGVRYEYLKHLKDGWEWVENDGGQKPYVLLKKRRDSSE